MLCSCLQVKAVQPRVSSLLPALFLHTTAIERFASVSSMARRRNVKADALAAVGVTLRAVRDSSDVFPPLKSATAAVIIVWEMSKVRLLSDHSATTQIQPTMTH